LRRPCAPPAGADVTPHILRHTCTTWLMQKGVNLWDAAGFLGMTVQQLEQGYGQRSRH
jgi:integrase